MCKIQFCTYTILLYMMFYKLILINMSTIAYENKWNIYVISAIFDK